MKTRHLVLAFAAFCLGVWLYPKLKVIAWHEPTRKEWIGSTSGVMKQYYYMEYLPSGEQENLGEIWEADWGWDASEFSCGILWHRRAYATKEMAMRAVEKWCGAPSPAQQKGGKP